MPSGPPKRRKKRSIGEPGWNGESSLLFALSSLATFSLMLTFTEITDGFTRSTMSAKPTGRSTLDFVVDLRMRRAAEEIHRSRRRAEAINGNAEAGDDRGHQRELARGKQRTAGRSIRREG